MKRICGDTYCKDRDVDYVQKWSNTLNNSEEIAKLESDSYAETMCTNKIIDKNVTSHLLTSVSRFPVVMFFLTKIATPLLLLKSKNKKQKTAARLHSAIISPEKLPAWCKCGWVGRIRWPLYMYALIACQKYSVRLNFSTPVNTTKRFLFPPPAPQITGAILEPRHGRFVALQQVVVLVSPQPVTNVLRNGTAIVDDEPVVAGWSLCVKLVTWS